MDSCDCPRVWFPQKREINSLVLTTPIGLKMKKKKKKAKEKKKRLKTNPIYLLFNLLMILEKEKENVVHDCGMFGSLWQ